MITFGTPALLDFLEPEDVQTLQRLGRRFVYSDGQVIHDRGDVGFQMIVVIKGSISLSRLHHNGKSVFVTDVGVGHNYADTPSVCGTKQLHHAVAVGETTVDQYSQQALNHILDNEPKILRALFLVASHRLMTAIDILDDTRLLPAHLRVAKLVRKMARTAATPGEIFCRREDLAAMLGLSTVTIIHSLQKMESQHLVSTGYGRIIVPDLDALDNWIEIECQEAG